MKTRLVWLIVMLVSKVFVIGVPAWASDEVTESSDDDIEASYPQDQHTRSNSPRFTFQPPNCGPFGILIERADGSTDVIGETGRLVKLLPETTETHYKLKRLVEVPD